MPLLMDSVQLRFLSPAAFYVLKIAKLRGALRYGTCMCVITLCRNSTLSKYM